MEGGEVSGKGEVLAKVVEGHAVQPTEPITEAMEPSQVLLGAEAGG